VRAKRRRATSNGIRTAIECNPKSRNGGTLRKKWEISLRRFPPVPTSEIGGKRPLCEACFAGAALVETADQIIPAFLRIGLDLPQAPSREMPGLIHRCRRSTSAGWRQGADGLEDRLEEVADRLEDLAEEEPGRVGSSAGR